MPSANASSNANSARSPGTTGAPAAGAETPPCIDAEPGSNAALRESEARFRQLADAMPQIVWEARADGTLDYYNRRWFEYIDSSPDAMDEARWDKYIHPDDLKRAYDLWSDALRTGNPYGIEFRVRGASGQYRWFLARALPVRDDRGAVIRWFGTCTDIQDQKELQARLDFLLESERAARSEAERAGRMKDEFLATLGHELRTPLNAILGWSQIMRRGPTDADDIAQGLEVIERNARAQSQIIEDLLDMSRIMSGKVQLNVKPLDLSAAVRSAVDTSRPAADAKGVDLRCAIDPLQGVSVGGDANRLQQVLWNLLSNAVKFTPKGGHVQVSLERVDSNVHIRVTDSGEGIKPEFLPFVFDRFRQADASTTRRHGGLGLGLSIVKQLVELHGGTVCVKSDGAGRGAAFIVTLPLSDARREAKPVRESQPARAPKSPALGDGRDCGVEIEGIRALVVDDEADARALVQRLLAERGAKVMTAASAADALALLQRETFDVLVTDIGMPGQDGYALMDRVRSLGAANNGNIPAIALTAYARSEDRTKAIAAGFRTHMAKPVEAAELIAAIAAVARRAPR